MIKIMGIQNYLKRVSKATKDIKSAIEEKGVSVAECDGIETLATAVRAIQTGTSSDGNSLFTVLAFKSDHANPATPSGGSFTSSAISYPTGWSDGAGLTKDIWLSYIIFKGDGSVYKNWVTPIFLSGVSSSTIDLTDYATKVWVTEQIKNAGTDGTIDLSNYATKSYVDSKIAEIPGVATTYVKSVNGTSGAITFTGSGVSQSGNTFTFSGGSGSGSGVSQTYVDNQDAATLKTAKEYAEGLITSTGVSSLNGLTGAVKVVPGSSNVSVATSANGEVSISVSGGGGDGDPGQDGDTYRTFNIYQNTDSDEIAPEISNGTVPPTWDTTNNKLLNCPTGWNTDQTSEKGKYTWMASGTFSKKSGGSMIEDWTGPFCITGEKGVPGADGSNLEFIYSLTSDETSVPAYPKSLTDLKSLFDAAEGGDDTEYYAEYNGQKWYNRAQSIDSENYRTCWMAQRVKVAGAEDWTYYSPKPVIWANWGSDGQDGDGVEYIFFTTDDAHKDSNGKWYSDDTDYTISYTKTGSVQGVSTNYDNTIDDWVPYGWLDEPVDIDKNIAFFEFCAIRKKRNGVWQEFGTPTLWAIAVNDGSDGNGFEQVFALYKDLVEDDNMSVDNASANSDNAHTTDEYLPLFIFNGVSVQSTDDPQSVSSTTPYQYVSVRRKPRGINTEWGDFSHPRLYNNYTKAALDEDVLQELKDTATNAAAQSIADAVSDINGVKEALGYKNGTYVSINKWNADSTTLSTTIGTVDDLNTTVSNFQQSLDSISGRVTTLEDNKIDTSGFLTESQASSMYAAKTNFETVESGLVTVQADFSQMSNIYGKYLMDEEGRYIDGNNYVIYANSDASKALYMKVVDDVIKYYTYDSATKKYTEYAGTTSEYHLLGADLLAMTTDDEGKEIPDEQARKIAREELSKYGVIIADNIAAIKTQVSEDSAAVIISALTKDSNAAALILESGRNGLTGDGTTTGAQAILTADNITLSADKIKFTDSSGENTIALVDSETGMFNVNTLAAGSIKTECIEGLLELSENVVNINSAINAIYAPDSELVVKKLETTNNGYTVKIGEDVSNVSTTKTVYASVESYRDYYYHEGDINFTRSSDVVYVESGNILYIPKINGSLNAKNLQSNKVFNLKAKLYKCAGTSPTDGNKDGKDSPGSDVPIRDLTFTTDSSSSLAIVSLSTQSNQTLNFSVNAITVSNLESGYYYIRFVGSGTRGGNSWTETSHARFYCDSFLFRTSSDITEQGVFIGTDSFKLSSGSNAPTGANLGEVSLSTTSNGVISNGFVLSPVVNNIQVVTSVPETVVDGVIYIVLAS